MGKGKWGKCLLPDYIKSNMWNFYKIVKHYRIKKSPWFWCPNCTSQTAPGGKPMSCGDGVSALERFSCRMGPRQVHRPQTPSCVTGTRPRCGAHYLLVLNSNPRAIQPLNVADTDDTEKPSDAVSSGHWQRGTALHMGRVAGQQTRDGGSLHVSLRQQL